MLNNSGPRRSSLVLLLAVVMSGSLLHGDPSQAGVGVVVEEVARESPAEKAGMRAGDIIVSWFGAPGPPAKPETGQGSIGSSFDLTEVEIEQAARGPVTLTGRRDQAGQSWSLPPGAFGLTVRPLMSEALLASYEEGRQLVATREPEAGAERWRAAGTAQQDGEPLLSTWLLSKAAKALGDAQKWPEADAAYGRAIQEAEGHALPLVAVQLLREWGALFLARSDWPGAERSFRRAVALDETLRPESLSLAMSLYRLGQYALLPGDLTAAQEYFRRSLAMQEKRAPGSLDVARTLNMVGVVARRRGDLATAEEYGRRALAIQEKLAPGSLGVAGPLNSLGIVAAVRGELAIAEDYHRRALAIREKLAPGSLDLSSTLNNLGGVADARGDMATAEDYARRALAIRERAAPRSLDVAMSLTALGTVLMNRREFATAEDYFRRALAIEEALAPNSLTVAIGLSHVGKLRELGGDLASAEEYYRRALATRETLAPGAVETADTLSYLGRVAAGRGRLAEAEEYHRRALNIRQRLAPGSAYEAESLHGLGLVYHQRGQTEQAADLLLRALDALENQKTKLGGTEETRSGFAALYRRYYHDSIEILIELGRPAEALHVLERSRARSLLALLAERDLLFTADLAPDLAQERKLVDAEYDRVQARIATLSPMKNEVELQELLRDLRETRQKQEEIASRIRRASPRFASVHYPQPLDADGVRSALDPGTVLLAYSVGQDRTVLFVVDAVGIRGSGLSVFSLPIGEKALREKVEAFRSAIQYPGWVGNPLPLDQSMELYDLLIRPAQSQVAASDRLLISPDGPLHSLPFAAMARKSGPRKGTRSYLIEWKPLHIVPSATVYAELKRSRRAEASPPGRLAAFGDPRYPRLLGDEVAAVENPEVRSAARDFRFSPLPFTRQEVEDIARHFPGRAQKYLGLDATEEQAKALSRDTRYIHFATHGVLDERFPLNSALALTIPEKPAEGHDNGLLQAWEIFDKVRLDADLVTLSACNTGLGKEMGGEGLLGLTRAFHYAGARSVLATLWAVSDRSTSLLMNRFYGYLAAGKTKDEALRAAQIDLIRTPSSAADPAVPSPPFRWAAFQLSGDWR